MGSDTGVFVGLMCQRVRVALRWQRSSSSTRYVGTGIAGERRRRAGSRYVLGSAGPEPDGRHGVLVVARGGPPGLPGSAAGRVPLALAGGVHAHPDADAPFVDFSRLRGALAGRALQDVLGAADGVRRSEGCGVLVLKRLSDAQRDGDRVLAVDPRHGGQPGRAQQRAHRAERAVAGGGDPRGARAGRASRPTRSTTSSATAPGTPLGDPIEVAGARRVLGDGRAEPAGRSSAR